MGKHILTIGRRWDDVGGRPSGFDYMRVGLAVLVAIWHSYQVAYGKDAAQAAWRDSPVGPVIALVLPMFFALSGFLVAGSMYRNPNLKTFLSLRAIRIYPALVVEVVLVALVLGPLVTENTLKEYFIDRRFGIYMLNMFGVVHFKLPGVFLHNPLPEVINSQLWTVPFELECYLVAAAVFVVGFFRDRFRVLPIFTIITIGIAALNIYQGVTAAHIGGWSGRVLVLCFVAGLVLHAFKGRIPLRGDAATVALLASAILPLMDDKMTYAVPILVAYGTVYLGLLNPPRSAVINSGDYSYGVYLYSNPIEQTVEFLLPGTTWVGNVAIALPITILFALFSWWCVELPFQKVKRLVLAPKTDRALQRDG